MGTVEVPAGRLWGAQTQRALGHFAIGDERMPIELYRAYGYVKKAAALANARGGRLEPDKAERIIRAAEDVISGALDAEFPTPLWQSGSGTQSHMNVNEVIANRAMQFGSGSIHPNDDVNLSQSSNDTFPTAMHISAVMAVTGTLLPRVEELIRAIRVKAEEWRDVVKIGRTHLQDAVPLTVGQEWSGWAAQLEGAAARIHATLGGLYQLAVGGTAVGTGLNAPPGFGEEVAAEIASLTGRSFVSAANKFASLGSLDAMVAAMAGLRGLAVSLLKIANDVRWLGSGPRCGIGELWLPANEPGSSIMPGKVNPSQCEALIMVAVEVMGADSAVAAAGSMGNLELNTMRPLVIHNFLRSCRLLGDACDAFRRFCVEGIELNRKRIAEYLERSLMLVTALTPAIGYDKAAQLAHFAFERDLPLREANRELGTLPEEEFDRLIAAAIITEA